MARCLYLVFTHDVFTHDVWSSWAINHAWRNVVGWSVSSVFSRQLWLVTMSLLEIQSAKFLNEFLVVSDYSRLPLKHFYNVNKFGLCQTVSNFIQVKWLHGYSWIEICWLSTVICNDWDYTTNVTHDRVIITCSSHYYVTLWMICMHGTSTVES